MKWIDLSLAKSFLVSAKRKIQAAPFSVPIMTPFCLSALDVEDIETPGSCHVDPQDPSEPVSAVHVWLRIIDLWLKLFNHILYFPSFCLMSQYTFRKAHEIDDQPLSEYDLPAPRAAVQHEVKPSLSRVSGIWLSVWTLPKIFIFSAILNWNVWCSGSSRNVGLFYMGWIRGFKKDMLKISS